MEIILASASPRRVELIKKIENLQVKVIPSKAEEKIENIAPELLVQSLAYQKAKEVHQREGGKVIGADTVVVDGGKVLGKPKDIIDAESMLKSLCGKKHKVLTGVCLIKENGKHITSVCTTNVSFKPYDEQIITGYLKTGSPLDKAGSYGIQDRELAPIIDKVEGDLDNVIGFPLDMVRSMIQSFFN